MAKNSQNIPNQAQAVKIVIKFQYFLSKNQLSGGFIAPFGPKTLKMVILTVFARRDPLKKWKKWPKFAEPDFCQHIQQVIIIVVDRNCSFYSKKQANVMERLGEIGEKGHFWPKMTKFGQKMAKMAKTRIFDKKTKLSLFYVL